MSFTFAPLEIPEVLLVERARLSDTRGIFEELYRSSVFSANGIPNRFAQDNYSRSTRGVLRGLHFQRRPKSQAKLVFVLRGEIFDAVVDIRKGSPWYGRWVKVVLSEQNRRLLYVPEGFAHGFCVLSAEADVVYKVTAEYAAELDRGIAWDDPEIGIAWPVKEPVLSTKDAELPRLIEADNNFVYGESA